MMHIQQQFLASYDPELHLLAEGPQSHRVRAECFVNGVKFVTSERDEGHVTQNNGVMVEGRGFNYYGVIVSVIELIYDKLHSNSVWYENELFIFATMTKQVFYLDDPAMGEGWKVVYVMSHMNIWSAATLRRDDESGPSELTTDQLNEPYQEESPHVVPDTEDIRVNNQHVPTIIGYIPVTPSKLNSLQRNPNHDDNGFIDDEYIENDEYSDETEEDDYSDDSDYHEYD
ncbi:hypothetical protein ACLB2K_041963 [Fragaria x ananassa]